MKNMERANCIGQWSLFDSRDLNDHHEARQLCVTCPVILECAATLRDVLRQATGGPFHGPQGTWAGRLIAGQRPKGRRAKCGTERAYQQHNHFGEPTDEACRAAHAAHNRKVS